MPRSSLPTATRVKSPRVSAADFVMMLITPLTAFEPQIVAPGPRMTSIRSMSSGGMSCMFQNTPEKAGV